MIFFKTTKHASFKYFLKKVWGNIETGKNIHVKEPGPGDAF